MLLFFIVLLEVLICLHVIGGAVLWRRFFPRESPWWGFFLPVLLLVSALNFLEHVVALPPFFWVLPLSTGMMIWAIVRLPFARKKLLLPSILFVVIFTFALAIRAEEPDINFYNTEGLTDLTRILDFCEGDKLPPTDCWLPPYDHAGYYTFMHYGASILKRFFSLEIGPTYNLAFALLNALTMLVFAAAAHGLGRYRNWIAIVMLFIAAGGFTGSTAIHALLHPTTLKPTASINIGEGESGDTDHAEFAWLLSKTPVGAWYRIYTPGCYLYYSEFHATVAGHFLTLLTAFAAIEVLRRKRTVFPWIYLLVAPFLIYISCPWFLFAAAFIAWPTVALAWWAGRRPTQWQYAAAGAAIWILLLLPTVIELKLASLPQTFIWQRNLTGDIPTFIIQWWPVYIPWIALCFAWKEMKLAARWLHFILLPILVFVELFFLTDRTTTLEKTWSATFGISVAILYPIVFIQRGWLYRGLSAVLILGGLISLATWTESTFASYRPESVLHLDGDSFIRMSPQLLKMEEALAPLHNQTVLTGKAGEAWLGSPCLTAFTGNRCFVGWVNAEESCGHGIEAHQRMQEANAFYDGILTAPLDFLDTNHINAVLVWPDDQMSVDWLTHMKEHLDPEFTYIDCRGKGTQLAGVFVKRTDSQAHSSKSQAAN